MTAVSLAAAPVLGAAFVAQQAARRRRGRAPLVDLRLFRSRTFAVGSLAGLTFALVPSSFFFVLALYLQQGRGYSALFSGVVFAAVGAGYFAALLGATRLAARLGVQVLAVGALVTAAGALLLAEASGGTSAWGLVPGLALVGFGIGAVLVPLSAMVLAGVDAAQAGAAAGVLSTAQQVGGATGVAAVGVVFFAAGTVQHAFVVSLLVVAGLTVLTAGLAQLLRR